MSKATTCKEAIASYERIKGIVAANAEKVECFGMCPPIEKMDAALGTLKLCRHLSLSTNSIEKIGGLSGMAALQTLSLGRNLIRKIEGLEPVADTLQQLWLSYNLLERLTGIEKLPALRVLYVSNNKLRDWGELDRLAALPALEELLLAGNPLHAEFKDRGALPEYRIEVLRRLPKLKKLDGLAVDADEREAAARPAAK